MLQVLERNILTKPLSNKKVGVVRLVNETCAIVLVQSGTQANEFASVIDCANNITNFTKNHARKFLFFSRFKADLLLNFCICHEKRYNQK